MRPWETIASRQVLDGAPWLDVWIERIRLPSGREIEPFYRYRKHDFTSVFALTTEGRVLAQRRYRHGPRAVSLDLPAGYLDPGESPLEAARRELLEETGHEAETWTPMGRVWTDGNSGGSECHLFFAEGARLVATPREDDTEEAELLQLTPAELRAHVEAGDFATLVPLACASRGLLHLAGGAP